MRVETLPRKTRLDGPFPQLDTIQGVCCVSKVFCVDCLAIDELNFNIYIFFEVFTY